MCRTRCAADVEQDVAHGCGEAALAVGTIYTRVTRVAGWAGWCSPCEREDRPLVLTRSGPAGLRAWLAGLGDDDRLLLLTCRVCGDWQHVPAREEDDPEVVLVEDDGVEAVAPAVPVPAPRTEQPAAARAQSQRTPSAAERAAPLDRSRVVVAAAI